MPKTTPEQNKAIVLEAFDTLFNKRDYGRSASGRRSTSSTARTSPDAKDYSLCPPTPDTCAKNHSLSQKAITLCARAFPGKARAGSRPTWIETVS